LVVTGPIYFGKAFDFMSGGSPPLTEENTDTSHPANISQEYIDIPYARQTIAQRLDIYLPAAGDKPYPVIAWFHGGGWYMGSKKDGIAEIAEPFLAEGHAFASINYRLTRRKNHFPAQIFDAKAAVRWLRANAVQYNLDPDRIIACGASAGGHLSALLGTSYGVKDLEDLSMGNPGVSSRVQAVVIWYPPVEFLSMDAQHASLGQEGYHTHPNSPESFLLNDFIAEVPEKCHAVSPLTYTNSHCPPFYIQHGKNDKAVPYLQSVILAEALQKVIGTEKVHLELLENAGHLDPVHMSPAYMNKVMEFLKKHSK